MIEEVKPSQYAGYCNILRQLPDEEVLPLSKLQPGRRGIIVRVGGCGPCRRRYMEMGFVRGETIRVERVAPLGDPVEYEIKGYHISLRRRDAAFILVSPTPAEPENHG